ncbi:conjugative transfer ATPase [Nitrogeniibacter aestuarii]|uniref:conjugative transfer ATPase n=1 Tax=Nitrogeniibacter aestuarii TaxID=2815343 RepID=UPI001E3D563A|nr:conjugative transfer ATPase [Nitrogeniibacter aestuarii]
MFGFIRNHDENPESANAGKPLSASARRVGLKVRERKAHAKRPASLTDHIPLVGYESESEMFLLEDGMSRVAMFELTPIPTTTRTEDYLLQRRREIENAISGVPELDDGPWVVQFFCNDDNNLHPVVDQMQDYILQVNGGSNSIRANGIVESALTQKVLKEIEQHIEQISRDTGLFVDDLISGEVWRGQIRRVRCVVYRMLPDEFDPDVSTKKLIDQVDHAASAVINALREAGITSRRMDLHDFWEWMLPFFNAVPEGMGSIHEMMQVHALPETEELAPQFDLGEALLLDWPESEPESGVWRIGKRWLRAIALQSIRQQPEVGHFTAERRLAEKQVARLDRLPVGTMLSATLVVRPQDAMKERLGRIQAGSRAQTPEAQYTYAETEEVLDRMAHRDKLYPFFLSVFVRGDSEEELRKNSSVVHASLSNAGLKFIEPRHELIGCDVLMRALPAGFDPAYDLKHMRRSRLMFASQIAAMLPVFGRARGTGNPGWLMWNRGGEPILVDPLNKHDRKKNAHMLVLGPTGAGKSATLNYLAMLVMAIHRPRLVIVDAGDSFGLLSQFFEQFGLSVHKLYIAPGRGVNLPVFANAMCLLDDPFALQQVGKNTADSEDDAGELPVSEDEGDDEEPRDYLGEMVIQARLMITGGEPNEEAKMSRSDIYLIQQALIGAAQAARAGGQPHPRVSDVANALIAMRLDKEMGVGRRERAEEMGQAMLVYCDGLRGELFNQHGTDWPDADVTVVELGTLAREGYEDALAVAYTSLINAQQSRIERDHRQGRPTIFLTDEGHIVTKNPLLSPFLAKATKMWRKLGAWFWLATQNMEDFPDQAVRILNMCEFWLCLVMELKEINDIGRFRTLTDEQRAMMESAKKAQPKYTEGVLLSSGEPVLMRNVPPALPIALAMTEQWEKADRQAIMTRTGCTELEAALAVAQRLKEARA